MITPSSIKLLVFDVDGVLTDGSIVVDDHGVESKRFHVRDGFAIRAAMSLGLKVGVLTGRSARAVTLRVAELGIDLFIQQVREKANGFKTLCQLAGVALEDTAYLGDDLVDLPAMLLSGYPMAVADAVTEVRLEAQFVTNAPGGHAAAREAIEHILKAQGRWDQVTDRYTVSSASRLSQPPPN